MNEQDREDDPRRFIQRVTPDDAARRRSRLSFLAIVAVAGLPLLIAYVTYFFMPYFVPDARSNEGVLIDPPVGIETLGADLAANEGKWMLLVPVSSPNCNEACERALYLARQVQRALGKDASRVRRTLLHRAATPGPALVGLMQAEYPNMGKGELGAAGERQLAEAAGVTDVTGYIFVADPNGNVMMYFAPDQEGSAILDDLKRLLRLSNIG